MFAGSPGERVRGEITILASVPELVACEVTISGASGEIGVVGTAELAAVSKLVAVEGVLYDSLWETLGVVLGAAGLDTAGWVTKELVVSDSCRDSVRVEEVVPVSVPELVAWEVTVAGAPDETIIVGGDELASTPGEVAVENMVSNSLWEKFGVILETGVLFSVEAIHEAVVSGSPGERVEVATTEMASVPGGVTCEAVVSASCGESVRVVKVVLVSAPELVTGEISTTDTPGGIAGVGMAELVCASGWVTNEAVSSGSPGEVVRV